MILVEDILAVGGLLEGLVEVDGLTVFDNIASGGLAVAGLYYFYTFGLLGTLGMGGLSFSLFYFSCTGSSSPL